ncbi:MAG: D-hexose-6-phosphate mutarotase [Pseudomonas sp.]
MSEHYSPAFSPESLPQGISLQANRHGRLFLVVERQELSARIAIEGAHIVECTPAGAAPLLWLSPDEPELPGQALRGGVPLCWPWFGNNRPGPAHGIARTANWQLDNVSIESGEIVVRLLLPEQRLPAEEGEELWQAEVEFRMGTDLHIALTSHNCGSSAQWFSQALHTYLPIADIDQVQVKGLADCAYLDQLTGQECRQDGNIRFNAEVDRIYFDHEAGVEVSDGGPSPITVQRQGSRSLVVWNPWIDKSKRLGHFPATGYRTMLCIEAANTGPDARLLQPGESHRLATRISRPQNG